MKKTIFCVIALGMSVATVYGQDEVTAINTGAANFLTIMPDAAPLHWPVQVFHSPEMRMPFF